MDVPFTAPSLSCAVVPADPVDPDVRVAIAGEVDLATAGQLEHVLTAQISAAEPGRRVRVDLSGVGFCGAVGARVLTAAVQRARERDVELRLAPRSSAVDLTLDICGWSAALGSTEPGPHVLVSRRERARRARDRLVGR
jgi:anti-anti-sigma factor